MPKYSLNPDGSLKIEDDSNSGFVVFGRSVKKISKWIAVLVVLASIVTYALVYYNNASNELLHNVIVDNGNKISSCYNVKIVNSAINNEISYLGEQGEEFIQKTQSGVEWIIGTINEIRKDVSY